MIFDSFTELERRAFLLSRVYEGQRQKTQKGFRCFAHLDESIKSTSMFKQFVNVLTWLDKEGWEINWGEVHWQGYVSYVFEKLAPTVPQPGQLKNNLLIKKYVKSNYTTAEVKEIRTPDQLSKLYSKILSDDVLEDTQLLKAMGIKVDERHDKP